MLILKANMWVPEARDGAADGKGGTQKTQVALVEDGGGSPSVCPAPETGDLIQVSLHEDNGSLY